MDRSESLDMSFVFKYEDMVKDTFSALQPMARFIGKDETQLADALKSASVRSRQNGKFYWKKQIGNYRNYLSNDAIDRYLRKHGETLNTLGYFSQ